MIKEDYFSIIEKAGDDGIRASDIARIAGSNIRSVSTWLSKWVGRGYIVKFKVDPDKLSPKARQEYDEELRKEKEERWDAAHSIDGTKSRRGGYKASQYRYKIDETCKEWIPLKYDDSV